MFISQKEALFYGSNFQNGFYSKTKQFTTTSSSKKTSEVESTKKSKHLYISPRFEKASIVKTTAKRTPKLNESPKLKKNEISPKEFFKLFENKKATILSEKVKEKEVEVLSEPVSHIETLYWNPNSIGSSEEKRQNTKNEIFYNKKEGIPFDLICLTEPYRELKDPNYTSVCSPKNKVQNKKFVQILARKKFSLKEIASDRDFVHCILYHNKQPLFHIVTVYMSYHKDDGQERRELVN